MYTTPLTSLTDTSEEEVKKILLSSAPKSCELDPVPTWLLKLCCDEILPLLTKIINVIMSSSDMPHDLKMAAVKPLLKKIILDLILKNYRPVSNLPFLSKLVEKVVLLRLNDHLLCNNFREMFQSAYIKGHSTETALLRVRNDVLGAMDKQKVTLLIMLDLSSAFDTIDHSILLHRLSDRLGIQGSALEWIKSYLMERTQFLSVEGKSSKPMPLTHGVPQDRS